MRIHKSRENRASCSVGFRSGGSCPCARGGTGGIQLGDKVVARPVAAFWLSAVQGLLGRVCWTGRGSDGGGGATLSGDGKL